MLPGPAFGAGQAIGTSLNGIAVIGPAGAATTLTAMQIQALPAVTISVSFGTDHGPLHAEFSGPLLWTVLHVTPAIDPKAPKLVLREAALVSGSDGYAALLALGEIAPAFEDKKVILATSMNGQAPRRPALPPRRPRRQ